MLNDLIEPELINTHYFSYFLFYVILYSVITNFKSLLFRWFEFFINSIAIGIVLSTEISSLTLLLFSSSIDKLLWLQK